MLVGRNRVWWVSYDPKRYTGRGLFIYWEVFCYRESRPFGIRNSYLSAGTELFNSGSPVSIFDSLMWHSKWPSLLSFLRSLSTRLRTSKNKWRRSLPTISRLDEFLSKIMFTIVWQQKSFTVTSNSRKAPCCFTKGMATDWRFAELQLWVSCMNPIFKVSMNCLVPHWSLGCLFYLNEAN